MSFFYELIALAYWAGILAGALVVASILFALMSFVLFPHGLRNLKLLRKLGRSNSRP